MGSVSGVYPPTNDASSNNAPSTSATNNSMSNTAAFLQLLVAQLKNQDPTKPMDPTTFVTQLAEFNDVEQNLATRQDVDAMSMKYLGLTSPPSANPNGASSADATSGSKSNSDASNGASGTGSSGSGPA